jgi:hypothetical protein
VKSFKQIRSAVHSPRVGEEVKGRNGDAENGEARQDRRRERETHLIKIENEAEIDNL